MTKYVYIRPAPAPTEEKPEARKHVRDPVSRQPVPPEGKEVLWDVYWDRRLVDEDIEIIDPPPAPPAPPEEGGGKSGRAKTQTKD